MNWLAFEEEARAKGYQHICGVDEAGRGPLAGPVCAAAVILPAGVIIEGVNDSKKLSEKKREALFEIIKTEAVSYILAKVSRDRLLYQYAREYPQYHFDKHKGYGTKVHVEALKEYGPCPYHRRSFLKKILK